MLAKKTLEINPHHSISKEMLRLIEEGDISSAQEEYAKLLYSTALINSGFDIGSESDEFTVPLQKLINVGFGLSRDVTIEEIEVEIDDEEEIVGNSDEEVEMKLDDLMVEDHTGQHDDL